MPSHTEPNARRDPAVIVSATCLAIALLLPPAAQRAQAEEDLTAVTARVLNATNAARESLPSARGSGRFTHTWTRLTDGVIRTHHRVDGSFTFAYSGRKSYTKFAKAPRDKWNAEIFILTGDAILTSGFSPEFPGGAKGWIWKQTKDHGWTDRHGIPPHFICEAATYVDVPGRYRLVSLEHERGMHVIQHACEERVPYGKRPVLFFPRRRFTIDPKRNHHVVRFELLYENMPRSVIEKDWVQNDAGLWYVRGYRYEMLPVLEGDGGDSWELRFDVFHPNVNVPDATFSSGSLGLPVGAYLWDYRVRPPDRIEIRAPSLTTLTTTFGRFR
jgi:hypothetical protein